MNTLINIKCPFTKYSYDSFPSVGNANVFNKKSPLDENVNLTCPVVHHSLMSSCHAMHESICCRQTYFAFAKIYLL